MRGSWLVMFPIFHPGSQIPHDLPSARGQRQVLMNSWGLSRCVPTSIVLYNIRTITSEMAWGKIKSASLDRLTALVRSLLSVLEDGELFLYSKMALKIAGTCQSM